MYYETLLDRHLQDEDVALEPVDIDWLDSIFRIFKLATALGMVDPYSVQGWEFFYGLMPYTPEKIAYTGCWGDF